jgi:UDP-N-acetyl-D-glucosamine/UDP-N-acetyl-D-galactosamine dehydrogenase
MREGSIVIYESTVYPGATEEVCVPILEYYSGLKYNIDFHVGYSPERINPGDKTRKIGDIKKLTSGSNESVTNIIDAFYKKVIQAGTHKCSSIKVAESAKVIENVQRDVNIALMNELAQLFSRLEIDTGEVLDAACTKWNFLNFKPGLVGGHCIGVDPYYLTSKAKSINFHPELILAGRKTNDSMPGFIVNILIKNLVKSDLALNKMKVLVLGQTFKENCPDQRNSKAVELKTEIVNFGLNVTTFDPWEIEHVANSDATSTFIEANQNKFDAIILAVAHDEFIESGLEKLQTLGKTGSIILDVKSCLKKAANVIRI